MINSISDSNRLKQDNFTYSWSEPIFKTIS